MSRINKEPIGFQDEESGAFITNPFMDASGRFEVEPCVEYGFKPTMDSQVCTLIKEMPDGGYMQISREDDIDGFSGYDAPSLKMSHEKVEIALVDADGDCHKYNSLAEAIAGYIEIE